MDGEEDNDIASEVFEAVDLRDKSDEKRLKSKGEAMQFYSSFGIVESILSKDGEDSVSFSKMYAYLVDRWHKCNQAHKFGKTTIKKKDYRIFSNE